MLPGLDKCCWDQLDSCDLSNITLNFGPNYFNSFRLGCGKTNDQGQLLVLKMSLLKLPIAKEDPGKQLFGLVKHR